MREVCQCVVTERMCACSEREDICIQRSQNAPTTELGVLFKRALTVLSALCQCPLKAIETLRGETMCANSEGIYGDNVRGMHRQKKKATVISDCSEMRTEGTSRPSAGMLSTLLRTETNDFESPAIRAHATLGAPPLTWPRTTNRLALPDPRYLVVPCLGLPRGLVNGKLTHFVIVTMVTDGA